MQALILAAGMGKRLRPHTNDRTKCMITLHGLTLLERSLDALTTEGVTRVVIVIGYEADGVRRLIGDRYANVPVTYVDNPDFATTNNIYSLYLARHECARDDTILLESDVVYDSKILRDLLAHPAPNVAVVDRKRLGMDGGVVTLSSDNTIQQFLSKDHVEELAHEDEPLYKTVNIYKLSRDYLTRTFLPSLRAYVRSEGRDEFYEEVLRVIVARDKHELVAMPLDGEKWYEIDDPVDYEIAQTLFAPAEAAYENYASHHGGYWRFPRLRDFCYLANPYFPPSDMLEEMRGAFDLLLRSYPSSGKVLDGLAAKMFDVDPAVITVGNGAAELIVTLGQVCRSSRLGISVPTFDEYLKRFSGTEIIEFSHGDPGLKPDPSRLAAVLDQTDTFVLVNPDNPSGQCLSTSELLELVQYAESRGKRLILDESFVDFTDQLHCASLLRQDILMAHPHLVILKSISKSYGVPGTRLGVLATADTTLLDQVRLQNPVWNVNSFGEYFLQIIGKYQTAYVAACEDIRLERARFQNRLSTVADIRVLPSHANYFLCDVGELMSSHSLAENLMNEHAILVKDCSTKVGMTGRQFVRVTVRDTADNDYFIAALKDTIARFGSLQTDQALTEPGPRRHG